MESDSQRMYQNTFKSERPSRSISFFRRVTLAMTADSSVTDVRPFNNFGDQWELAADPTPPPNPLLTLPALHADPPGE
jgi:hypothetical protein